MNENTYYLKKRRIDTVLLSFRSEQTLPFKITTEYLEDSLSDYQNCVSAGTLIITLYNSLERCYHWETWERVKEIFLLLFPAAARESIVTTVKNFT